jgi:hypothetical protein
MQSHLAALSALIQSPRFLHPADAPAGLGGAEALRWLQDRIGRWGGALVAWPDIWSGAVQLADEGVRLTVPITI